MGFILKSDKKTSYEDGAPLHNWVALSSVITKPIFSWYLTLEKLFFFLQCDIIFSCCSQQIPISAWNHSNTMNILSAWWVLITWCLSTRASVATVLSKHPCISSCLWVKQTSKATRATVFCYFERKGIHIEIMANVMAPQTTGNIILCSTYCSGR